MSRGEFIPIRSTGIFRPSHDPGKNRCGKEFMDTFLKEDSHIRQEVFNGKSPAKHMLSHR